MGATHGKRRGDSKEGREGGREGERREERGKERDGEREMAGLREVCMPAVQNTCRSRMQGAEFLLHPAHRLCDGWKSAARVATTAALCNEIAQHTCRPHWSAGKRVLMAGAAPERARRCAPRALARRTRHAQVGEQRDQTVIRTLKSLVLRIDLPSGLHLL